LKSKGSFGWRGVWDEFRNWLRLGLSARETR
jgi:hypothetical protein